MKGAYYNEIDPYAAAWLRNLIAAGHIAPGDVDERDIRLVQPAELAGYTQCHFFAGIGVWSYALRLAGWSDDRSVWTGSCPCQPFSTAGARQGHEDERHLWPAWFGLIRESRPVACFGEQVADGDGYAWLDHVGYDLEGIGYALGAVCPAACGFGAPHERQRLFFVADADERGSRRHAGAVHRQEDESFLRQDADRAESRGAACELADDEREGRPRREIAEPGGRQPTERSSIVGNAASERRRKTRHEHSRRSAQRTCDAGQSRVLAYAGGEGLPEFGRGREQSEGSPTAGFWSSTEWLACRDGKARPVEPGTFPLAHGATARVGRLRAYGNAIVAPVAAEFIGAYMRLSGDTRLE